MKPQKWGFLLILSKTLAPRMGMALVNEQMEASNLGHHAALGDASWLKERIGCIPSSRVQAGREGDGCIWIVGKPQA